MEPISIKIVILGQLPANFDPRIISRWKSKLFKINPDIETFQLNVDAEGDDWEYTDNQLEKYFDTAFSDDFAIIILNVKLQYNWYVRRLTKNRLLFTFFELKDILNLSNIPTQNALLRVIYAATLVYKRYGNRIPSGSEDTNYAHDEMRGCLFDMNPSKWDIIYSCNKPKLCEFCISELKRSHVSNEVIEKTQSEIKNIKKTLFYRITDFVKLHPIWSIIISLATALVVGVISSIFGSYLFKLIV